MGFNYTEALRVLCVDICRRLPELRHIDVSKLGFSISNARDTGRSGVWGAMIPTRFKDGLQVLERTTEKRAYDFATRSTRIQKERSYYTLQKLRGADKNTEYLYVLRILYPRFFDLSFEEKLETIIHELYHISEKFNGDIRRFPGRNWQHGSKSRYQKLVSDLAFKWLEQRPDEKIFIFLKYNADELRAKLGEPFGTSFPIPKLVKIDYKEAIKLEPSRVFAKEE